ncbi:MAG TPA: SDR family oxidoreductase [Campylobacterales bacterium]|nr:SDR family oxidoreductase [Campylobacterales bacterium]
MKNAVVTGASSGIGKACAKKLLELGYKVYGLSRTCNIIDKNFIHVEIDLTDTKQIQKLENTNPHVLINCAGVGYFAPHEELSFEQIQEMIALNLTAPMLVTKLFLRALKQQGGYIFNINSISGIQPALFGATYGASKAGLRHFGTSLFKEARKSGLKVININPDITNTPFFDSLNFKPTQDSQTYIDPKDIADIIENVLNQREGTVMTDITIEPQKFQISKKK